MKVNPTSSRNLAAGVMLVFIGVGWVAPEVDAQYVWDSYEGNPVIGFDFDQTSTFMFRPAVLRKDNQYHMWYGKQVGLPFGSPRSVGYAVSEDGINWQIENLFAIEPGGGLGSFDGIYATNASVVDEGDTLKMWYNGIGQLSSGIGYAWSVDGSEWTKVRGSGSGGSVFDAEMDGSGVAGVVAPTVVQRDGQYYMWYQKLVNADGRSRVGLARSSNGVNWVVVPGLGVAGSVLDIGSSSDFDADQIWWPWVLYNEEKALFEMWYQGIDAEIFGGVPRLGCARSVDGISWEKVVGDGDAGACRNSLAQPAVLFEGGIYKMWYALTTEQSPNNDVVLYATSDPLATRAEAHEIPSLKSVLSAYPNPSPGSVMIEFESSTPEQLDLEIVDQVGRIVFVKRIIAVPHSRQRIRWEGKDSNSQRLAAGLYFVRLRSPQGPAIGTLGLRLAK